MAQKQPKLTVIGPEDNAPCRSRQKTVPKDLVAALSGDRWEFLAAMRKELVTKIENGEVSSNSIASTFKELREIDRLIRVEERAREDGGGVGDLEDEEFDPLAI